MREINQIKGQISKGTVKGMDGLGAEIQGFLK